MKVMQMRAIAWKRGTGANIDVVVTFSNNKDRRIEGNSFHASDAASAIHCANVARDNVALLLMDAGAHFEHGAMDAPPTLYGYDNDEQ